MLFEDLFSLPARLVDVKQLQCGMTDLDDFQDLDQNGILLPGEQDGRYFV